MIVSLRLTRPDGQTQTFELERTRVVIGAGSRCDVVVPSSAGEIRAVVLDVSTSGFRVAELGGDVVQAVLPGESVRRPITSDLLLPPGATLHLGAPPLSWQVVLSAVRRALGTEVSALGVLPAFGADGFVEHLAPATRAAALRLAFRVSGLDEPGRLARELSEFFRSVGVESVQVALSSDADDGWTAASSYGATGATPCGEKLGLESPDLQAALSGGVLLSLRRSDARIVAAPLVSAGRLKAVLLLALGDGSPDDVALRDAILAARPFVVAFVARVQLAAARAGVVEENGYFRQQQRRQYLFKEFVCESVAMRRVHRAIGQLVLTDAPVLLRGEAGTGKELLARALHHLGAQSAGLLVSQVCALDETALEAELFGVGAVDDGATPPRSGLFELASGGTAFLDEVHALSPRLQLKVLRAVTEGEVFRIGESVARRVSVRLVAATHVDLMALADDGRYRRDLALALSKHPLDVPALRDRREDIAPLVDVFVAGFARRYRRSVRGVDSDTLAWLQKLRWPGNVRELSTVVERAVLQAPPDQELLARADFELR